MRNSFSIVVFLVTLTGVAVLPARAEEGAPLSPLQSSLKKLQSGEAYGMKTAISSPPAPPKNKLNNNAQALSDLATAQSQKKTRLQQIESAYESQPAPATDIKAPAEPAVQDQKIVVTKDAPPTIVSPEKAALEKLQSDQPKIPKRLISVE